MTFATGTVTRAEAVELYEEVAKLEVILRPYSDGAANPATGQLGRFTAAQVDAAITAVSAAITAVNAS